MRFTWLVIALLVHRISFGGPDATEPDTLAPPVPESTPAQQVPVLPAIPSFELPQPAPDFFEPKYLRVRGKKHLDTDITVKGYIIWIYDCVRDIGRANESRAATLRRIDVDPTLCERPKLYLASTRDTPIERGLWVVDVPRPPNKLEKARLPEEELAAWPAVPKLKIGDYVAISGSFALESPHRERNSDGLLVFRSIEPAKPPARAPAPSTTASSSVTTSLPTPAKPSPAMRKVVDPKVVNISLISLQRGNKHAANKQFAEAIDAYRRAIASWDGNHLAWYGLGGAYAQQGNWKLALDAFHHATKLRPDAAAYRMWTGIAAYEAAVMLARETEAAKAGVEPSTVNVDLSRVVFDDARAQLEQAIALDAGLWRAHYYLGRIARNADLARVAAEHFTRAIRADSTKQGPYVALGELYRKWDYPQEAIVVTELGAKSLPATDPSTSDVHYVLGMAHDDRKAYARAIAAYTRALEIKPDNHKALFQRGQAYVRLRKRNEARRDLEAFLAADSASLAFARQQAAQMLVELGARPK